MNQAAFAVPRRAGGPRTSGIARVSMVPLTHQEEVVTADGIRLRRGRLFDGTSSRSFIAARLEETRDALRAGASGVVYGRRLWQADDPAKLAAAVRAIIHQEGSG